MTRAPPYCAGRSRGPSTDSSVFLYLHVTDGTSRRGTHAAQGTAGSRVRRRAAAPGHGPFFPFQTSGHDLLTSSLFLLGHPLACLIRFLFSSPPLPSAFASSG